MLDTAIIGGTVIDGTGGAARRADVGIRDGRVVAVGELDESATHTVDATDLVVTPGFVDPHTHYDAQLFWDPLATPSSWHGVTSVIGGNCGFTIAPLKERDADYTRRLMERVEGMPLAALEQGVRWTWDSFGEFLDAFEGNIAVNAGFMVGSLRAASLRDGRRRHASRSHARRARGDAPADAPVAGRRWARALDQSIQHAPRRRRSTGAEPVRVGAGAARAVRRRRRASRARRSRRSRRAASPASTTARSSCSRR